MENTTCAPCPHCYALTAFQEDQEGCILECQQCKDSFEHVTCVHCNKSNAWLPGQYQQGAAFACSHCSKSMQQLNCAHCSRSLVWANADHQPGALVHCPHCNNKFQQLGCISCSASIVYPHGDYKMGTSQHCEACQLDFVQLSCPHCCASNTWRSADYVESSLYKCQACTKAFQHISCPHCQNAKVWLAGQYVEGSLQTCAACAKSFQQVNCAHCSASNVYRDANYCEGTAQQCSKCYKSFTQVSCTRCRAPNVWPNADFVPGTQYACTSCHESFQQIPCHHCSQSNVWPDCSYMPAAPHACLRCKENIGVSLAGAYLVPSRKSLLRVRASAEPEQPNLLRHLTPPEYAPFLMHLTTAWNNPALHISRVLKVLAVHSPELQARYDAYSKSLGVPHGGEQVFFRHLKTGCATNCLGCECCNFCRYGVTMKPEASSETKQTNSQPFVLNTKSTGQVLCKINRVLPGNEYVIALCKVACGRKYEGGDRPACIPAGYHSDFELAQKPSMDELVTYDADAVLPVAIAHLQLSNLLRSNAPLSKMLYDAISTVNPADVQSYGMQLKPSMYAVPRPDHYNIAQAQLQYFFGGSTPTDEYTRMFGGDSFYKAPGNAFMLADQHSSHAHHSHQQGECLTPPTTPPGTPSSPGKRMSKPATPAIVLDDSVDIEEKFHAVIARRAGRGRRRLASEAVSDDEDDGIARPCPHCGKQYRQNNSLYKHLYEHHPQWTDVSRNLGLSKHQQVLLMQTAELLLSLKDPEQYGNKPLVRF